MKKILFTLVLLGLVGAVGWQVWKKLSETGPGNRQGRGQVAVAVEVAPVERGEIRDIRGFSGSLFASYEFTVAPKIAGRLEKLLVNIGDTVKQGQIVAHLEDAEYAQQVEQAKAELEVAEAQLKESISTLESAQREYERVRQLHAQLIAPESELDAKNLQVRVAESRAHVAQASVTQRRAALNAAEVRLSYTRVRAEWEEGSAERVVGEKFVDEGAMLRANDPICTVLDIDPLTAIISVIERDYPSLAVGQRARIATDAFPGREFEGRVSRIAPLLKETSRTARIELSVDNAERRLKPGMFARVELEFARHENALVVPVMAVISREGRTGVFFVDETEMKARFVDVKFGIVNTGHAEIIEPALNGKVVTLGHHLLSDGAPVLLSSRTPPTGAPGSDPARGAGEGRRATR